jgi:hypothetical protein
LKGVKKMKTAPKLPMAAALCCAGKLLTGNTGSLCKQQPLKALRAPCGPTPQYKILYYYGSPESPGVIKNYALLYYYCRWWVQVVALVVLADVNSSAPAASSR